MTLLWSFLLLIILVILATYLVVRKYENKVAYEELRVEGALWLRRAQLPLLMELSPDFPQKKRLIQIRREVSTTLDQLALKIEAELEISDILKALEKLQKNTLLLSVWNELRATHEDLLRRINDYNFQVEAMRTLLSPPWMKLAKIFARREHLTPLPFL